MRRSLPGILIFALLLAAAGAAGAQDESQLSPEAGQVTVYGEKAFIDEIVQGDQLVPDGTLITGKRKAKTSSLITVRSNFRSEILKTVEDL